MIKNNVLINHFIVTKRIYIFSFISFFMSILCGELFSYIIENSSKDMNGWLAFIIVISMLVTFIIPIIPLVGAIYLSFKKQYSEKTISFIIASYISIIVTFTGIYYVMTLMSDQTHIAYENIYYQYLQEEMNNKDFPHNMRAFRGMSNDLFIGVEANVFSNEKLKGLKIPSQQKWIAMKNRGYTIKFLPENRLIAINDCFYLSVVTITTLGYGDIIPNRWFSKLATSIEALLGMIILIFAFGLALNNQDKKLISKDI